jgi:hypothetical protein
MHMTDGGVANENENPDVRFLEKDPMKQMF